MNNKLLYIFFFYSQQQQQQGKRLNHQIVVSVTPLCCQVNNDVI